MQIKLTVALLALAPLLSVASPAPAPVTKVPFAKKRSFVKENGVADIEALVAHVDEVKA
jgi:hypothetical protein